MKIKTKENLVKVGFTLLILIGIVYAINLAFGIQSISGQQYLEETTSPNGTYTVTAYLNNGGATTDYAVLCILKNNKTGKMKNIYWKYHCMDADMEWLNDKNIEINGIELNVKYETYNSD